MTTTKPKTPLEKPSRLPKKSPPASSLFSFNLRITILTALILFLPTTIAIYQISFTGKIYPFIKVAGVSVTGLTPRQAQDKLEHQLPLLSSIPLATSSGTLTLDTAPLNLQYDWAASANSAYRLGRTGSLLSRLKSQIQTARHSFNLPLVYRLDPKALDEQVGRLADRLNLPSIPPQIKLQNSQVTILPGQSGQQLDTRTLKLTIQNQLAYHQNQPIPLPLIYLSQDLTPDETTSLKQRAQTLIGKQLLLTADNRETSIKTGELLPFLDAKTHYNQDQLATWVNQWADTVNRPPQNAKFTFSQGKVTEFQPALLGLTVEKDQLLDLLTQTLSTLETTDATSLTLTTPLTTTPPDIATQDVNNLGIKDLIGHGQSRFKGSIPSRIHNIALATSRLNGILVPPGQTFSFNDHLGDISAFTGYEQAYIIKSGQTILGDGGGVCQVSTTLFRAVLNAGLPTLERTAHAYRVGYYEQDTGGKPGFDATVYSPTTDFKFKNDTSAHILIQTQTNTKTATLTFDLYGTSDGRITTLGTPQLWDITPAPPDLYIDDPTLPTGTVKQIDWAAPGTKAKFTWKVTRGNELLQDKTFYSSYKPWQAKFLRGTGPAQ